MGAFEEFSKEIDDYAKRYPNSWSIRMLGRINYWLLKHWYNKPLPFAMVEGQGEPVGEPMDVRHLSLHDMMPHAVCGQLTAEVLLKGRRINAFSREGYKQMEKMVGRTTIQPRWV